MNRSAPRLVSVCTRHLNCAISSRFSSDADHIVRGFFYGHIVVVVLKTHRLILGTKHRPKKRRRLLYWERVRERRTGREPFTNIDIGASDALYLW